MIPESSASRAAHAKRFTDEHVKTKQRTFDKEIRARFGDPDPTKADPYAQLRRGLIGVAVDYSKSELVAVVDPARVDRNQLSAAIVSAATADKARAPQAPTVASRTGAACNSTADLLEAVEVLRAADWHPRAKLAHSGHELNAADSTFHVYIDDAEVSEALKKRLGKLVTVVDGRIGPSAGTRNSDSMTASDGHWGGARIQPTSGGEQCTAGFTVDLPTAAQGQAMVTAGHCFTAAQQNISSGSNAYGVSITRPNFPTFDVRVINSSGQNYDDDIHTNPRSPATRDVTSGSANPELRDLVCVSGQVTLAVCGVEVENFTSSIRHTAEDGGGLTEGLMKYRHLGNANVSEGGDSGAPVYVEVGGGQVRIVGLNVGQETSCDPAGPDTCNTGYGETVSSVRVALGSGTVVADQPCWQGC
ncbi:MAG: hypothetical protein ACT4QF_13295 [Sporichthyaceae bacterium]